MSTVSTKKKSIPKVVKDHCWNKWVGDDIAKTKCLCCNLNEIKMNSFHCGHIIAEANGGITSVENLRPICKACNLSMGTTNLDEFKMRCGFSSVKNDESDTPVEWSPELLASRTPKYICAPKEKLVRQNGKMFYLVSGGADMLYNISGKYTIHSTGIYKRI